MSGFFREFQKLGRAFSLLWLGETAYGLGAGLMRFALGVWVYQKSGSTEQFAFVFLAATIPSLLIIPWAGTLADHFERRWVIVWADAVAALLAVGLAALLLYDRLTVTHLYIFSAVGAVIGSLRTPSYQAAITSVLPQETLTRASGLIGLSQGVLSLIVPILAGALMAHLGLRGIVMIQVPVVIAGGLAVFGAFSQSTQVIDRVAKADRPPFLRGMVLGLAPAIAFFRKEPLMRQLLVYMVVHDGLVALASGMLTPLILATHSSSVVGLVTSAGAAGGLAGSIMLTVANTQKRLVAWMLIFNVGLSTCVVVAGLRSSTMLWSICAFIALFAGTASGGCAMSIWMRKTPNENRGSVFSMLGASQLVVASVVMLVGGLLAEHVLEPSLAVGGRWESTVGAWLGTGKGRGVGLLFVLSGLLCTAISLFGLARSGLRRLDSLVGDLPTALESDPVLLVPPDVEAAVEASSEPT